jgi:membrane-bound serine protease (ClpP class)
MLLPPEEEAVAGASLPPAQSPALLGAIGVVVTALRPAGKARFDDQFIDVVAEGHYVEVGMRVQVIEIDGMRVVVKSV